MGDLKTVRGTYSPVVYGLLAFDIGVSECAVDISYKSEDELGRKRKNSIRQNFSEFLKCKGATGCNPHLNVQHRRSGARDATAALMGHTRGRSLLSPVRRESIPCSAPPGNLRRKAAENKGWREPIWRENARVGANLLNSLQIPCKPGN